MSTIISNPNSQSLFSTNPLLQKKPYLEELINKDLEALLFHEPYDKIKSIQNVHRSKISCMHKLQNGNFLTASIDGAIKLWNVNANLIQTILEPDPIHFKDSITCMAAFEDDTFLTGNISGGVKFWDLKNKNPTGVFIYANPSKELAPFEKRRKLYRVTHICAYNFFNQNVAYIGWPTQFSSHYKIFKQVDTTWTSHKDWVTAIHPITDRKLLIISGRVLELFERQRKESFQKDQTLLAFEDETLESPKYICASKELKNTKKFAIATLDQDIAIFDLASKTLVAKSQKLPQGPTQMEPLSESLFATGSLDGKIRLFDTRIEFKEAVSFSEKKERQISSLLQLDPNTLVSAIHRSDIFLESSTDLSVWDIRYV